MEPRADSWVTSDDRDSEGQDLGLGLEIVCGFRVAGGGGEQFKEETRGKVFIKRYLCSLPPPFPC